MSVMMRKHLRYAGHYIEAELLDFTVKAKIFRQLEKVSIKIGCKLLYALLTIDSVADPGLRPVLYELFYHEYDLEKK